MTDHTPRLLDALDAFEDGIYIISEDYTVEYMNKFMKDLFGEGVGKKCYEVLIGSDKPCDWCNHDKVFINDETNHSEVYIESVDKTIHSNISMLGEKRLEKSVLRDLETLYLEEPFPSPTLFSDQHKNFVLSQKEGPITKELIYKQINGHVRYRLNEIRHLENKKCVYTISLKYGTGSNNLYPEFIVIQDISMKYKLQINVRYII